MSNLFRRVVDCRELQKVGGFHCISLRRAFGTLVLFLLAQQTSSGFSADKPHAVVVVGTHHYSPQVTMPKFAAELERLGFEATVVNPDWDPEKDERGLPGLAVLEQADVGIFFVRFLQLEKEQLRHIVDFVESGKPLVCFRTSTHAFNYPEEHPRQELNRSFGREAFGTPYLIHLQGQTEVKLAEVVANHPILTGVPAGNWNSPGTLYLTALEPGATPLLLGTGRPKKPGVKTNPFGTHDLKEVMTDIVAWTWENQWGGRVFGTSLGHVGDFSIAESMRVMVNGVFWAAGQKVLDSGTEIRAFTAAAVSKKKARVEAKPAGSEKPNVILVMTDDQGYGDFSCHGNPILKTPHLDDLHADAVRFTDFHVSPFCTPTRAALMTGNYPGYTGAYRTSSGRTMMHLDEKTLANLFGENGYATGMVGKWHLGDNAPHRPQDRGFHDVVWHRCGGIGQASDYWGNDYFDDTYERNGKFEKFEGYCTDVWFREGMRFVEENREKPFFLYLALNAPHGPYRVPPEWADPYQGNKDIANANFYGMVANIDHNMGLLRDRLDELGLAENTILIFMTDNGTAGGGKFQGLDSEPVVGYNAGMRGKKSSVYDGGHRVPFFVHWPKGGLVGGKDIDTLAAHIDVLPTLAELCGLPVTEEYVPDGISLKSLLDGDDQKWKRDHHVVQFLGGAYAKSFPPKRLDYSVVMTEQWRLVHSDGQALFDIGEDPAQRNDVAGDQSEVVADLLEHYDTFWKKISPRLTPVRIDLGNPAENPTMLCSQDWYMAEGNPPWNFGSIRKLPKVSGPWMVNVRKAGRYRITLRQLPKEADELIVAEKARIEIAGKTAEVPVEPGSKGVVFEMELPAGLSELKTWLYDKNGKAGGAYFTEVELL